MKAPRTNCQIEVSMLLKESLLFKTEWRDRICCWWWREEGSSLEALYDKSSLEWLYGKVMCVEVKDQQLSQFQFEERWKMRQTTKTNHQIWTVDFGGVEERRRRRRKKSEGGGIFMVRGQDFKWWWNEQEQRKGVMRLWIRSSSPRSRVEWRECCRATVDLRKCWGSEGLTDVLTVNVGNERPRFIFGNEVNVQNEVNRLIMGDWKKCCRA